MEKVKIDDLASKLVRKYKKRPRSRDILRFLLNFERGVAQKQISDKTGAHKVVVSKQLREFETDQLVKSNYQNRKDRRKKFYFLTELGRKISIWMLQGEKQE